MTIGRSSRQSSARSSIRAPKFLDKSTGFYGRLEEPEVAGEGEEVGGKEVGERLWGTESSSVDEEAAGKAEGMMGDDGETLLQRKPSRLSSRWRSTRRKQKEARVEEEEETAESLPSEFSPVVIEVLVGEEDGAKEAALVHFATREDEDDQVLIRDAKRGRDEEGEEEWRMRKEQEEGMKMVKRNAVKNYRKVEGRFNYCQLLMNELDYPAALDRAFRRGWGAFVTNLYSVTLTPVKPASSRTTSPSAKKQQEHSASVLAEFQ